MIFHQSTTTTTVTITDRAFPKITPGSAGSPEISKANSSDVYFPSPSNSVTGGIQQPQSIRELSIYYKVGIFEELHSVGFKHQIENSYSTQLTPTP